MARGWEACWTVSGCGPSGCVESPQEACMAGSARAGTSTRVKCVECWGGGSPGWPAFLHPSSPASTLEPLWVCHPAMPHADILVVLTHRHRRHIRDLFFPSRMTEPRRPSPLCSARGFSPRSGERVWNGVRCGTTPYKARMPATPYPMIPHTRTAS